MKNQKVGVGGPQPVGIGANHLLRPGIMRRGESYLLRAHAGSELIVENMDATGRIGPSSLKSDAQAIAPGSYPKTGHGQDAACIGSHRPAREHGIVAYPSVLPSVDSPRGDLEVLGASWSDIDRLAGAIRSSKAHPPRLGCVNG